MNNFLQGVIRRGILLISIIMVLVILGPYNKIYAATDGATPNSDVIISGGVLSAQVDVSNKRQIINVSLTDVVSTNPISQVIFHFVNINGEDVFQVSADATVDGVYTASINSNCLTPKYGEYIISAEVFDTNGGVKYLDSRATCSLVASYTDVQVTDVNKTDGTFKVSTSNIYAAEKISKVSIKVWCDGEDVDAKTYKAKKQKNGTYTATINAKNHQYHSGKYQVSVLVKLSDGNVSVAATTSCKMKLENFAVYGKTSNKFIKKIYFYNPTIKKNAYVDLWSEFGKGADKERYKATYVDGVLEITCTMSKLKGPGTAYIQLLEKNGDKYKKIKKYSFDVSMAEIIKTGWHYAKCSNGKTYKFYYKEGKRVNNVTKLLKLKKESDLHIEVNRAKNRVTVYAYDEKTKKWCIPVIAFKCSVGTSSTPTPRGTYKTDRKHRWKALMGPSWGQYATHVVGGIYFHSVAGSTTNSYGISAYAYNKLGGPASHGCIRLTVRDAKWIFDYAALKTTVTIFDADYAGPLEPQEVPKIPANQHYDPTDPAVKKK